MRKLFSVDQRRLQNFDCLKGFGIILMIISHTGLAATLKIDTFINAFYMPMFFLISGFFLHIQKYSFFDYFIRKFKRLLIPYLIWGSFHFLIWMIIYELKITELSETPETMIVGLFWNNNVHLPIAGALWFISCLFFVSFFAFCCIKSAGITFYCFASVFLAVFGFTYHPFLPWSMDSALIANLIFCFGYLFNNMIMKINIGEIRINGFGFFIILLVLFFLGAYVNGFTNIRECNYGHFPALYIIVALLGIIICWIISSALCDVSGVIAIAVIRYPVVVIGQYSMSFVCLNQLVIAVLTRVFPNIWESQLIQVTITILVICTINKVLFYIDKKQNWHLYSFLFGR